MILGVLTEEEAAERGQFFPVSLGFAVTTHLFRKLTAEVSFLRVDGAFPTSFSGKGLQHMCTSGNLSAASFAFVTREFCAAVSSPSVGAGSPFPNVPIDYSCYCCCCAYLCGAEMSDSVSFESE